MSTVWLVPAFPLAGALLNIVFGRVIGRRAATVPGFRYSPALIAAGARGLVWTRAALDAYLADPQRFLPGTEMAMPGLGVADDRRDVIDYLQRSNPTPRRTP